eukprot:193389_1
MATEMQQATGGSGVSSQADETKDNNEIQNAMKRQLNKGNESFTKFYQIIVIILLFILVISILIIAIIQTAQLYGMQQTIEDLQDVCGSSKSRLHLPITP